MHCPICGAENLPNAAFCSQCAASLLVPPHLAGAVAHGMVPRTSGMAIAGFVLSFFCGLLGLVFSSIGYSECRKGQGMVSGEGLAIAGIIISIVHLLVSIAIYGGSL